ncbi:MAG: hypothetical protein NVSMB25_26310 [Thermoleophilaceae bacterium]
MAASTDVLEHDLIEETVALPGRELSLLRPRDSETLLEERAFENEELLPYWAELWPSGVALAGALAPRALRGARTLELGCGLGLASIAAALAGGRVLATDWSAAAIAFTRVNAERNAATLETALCSWLEPAELVHRAPWDLVIAADILYERANIEPLLALLPRLAGPHGEVLIADPGRPAAADFLSAAAETWKVTTRADRDRPSVSVHLLVRL